MLHRRRKRSWRRSIRFSLKPLISKRGGGRRWRMLLISCLVPLGCIGLSNWCRDIGNRLRNWIVIDKQRCSHGLSDSSLPLLPWPGASQMSELSISVRPVSYIYVSILPFIILLLHIVVICRLRRVLEVQIVKPCIYKPVVDKKSTARRPVVDNVD